MPVVVDCRTCGRKLRVTDELFGRKVQCPSCGETFHAEGSSTESPPETNGYHVNEENGTPPSAPEPLPTLEMDRELHRCPRCNESVGPEDDRCRYCGAALVEEDDDRPWERPPRQAVRRDCEPERGGVVLTMGIISLVLPIIGIALGLAAWIMGAKDLGKMRRGQMDPNGQGTTQAGLICGIIGLVLQLLMTLSCVLPMVLVTLAARSAARMPPPRPVRVAPAPTPFPGPAPVAPNPVRVQPQPFPQPPRIPGPVRPIRPVGPRGGRR